MTSRKKAGNATRHESKYYIAKTVNGAKEKIEDKVTTYNDKYLKKKVENGRKFVTEFKTAPLKKIDGLLGDGKDALKKARSTRISAIQKKVDSTRQDVRTRVETINRQTRKVYRGIEGDAKLIVEDVVSLGKKKMGKLSVQKTIKDKISSGIDSIPRKLNLPSKSEIDRLLAGVDGANKKVDALSRQYARA
jgi:hypothetical protein